MSELHELETRFTEHPEEGERFLAQDRATQISERGERLIDDVEHFITRFVSLPPGLGLPLALWALATHLFNVSDAFPYLAITSPTKRCGKTRLSEVLASLCAKPEQAANLSEAVLFRLVDKKKPTLFIDEAESLRGKKSERSEALVGLLNAGHRQGARTYRCKGQSHEPAEFDTYCPKVIMCIGSLPDTLADRSIPVAMQRRQPGERLDRFITRRVKPVADALQERLEKAARFCREDVKAVYGSPDFDLPNLEDREAENWTPLFAVASVLSPSRLDELQRTALRLAGEKVALEQDESLGLRLLADARKVWKGREASIPSEELLRLLRELPESSWAADFELTARRLSRLLRPFGVEPRNIRSGEGVRRGYMRAELENAWERYLPSA